VDIDFKRANSYANDKSKNMKKIEKRIVDHIEYILRKTISLIGSIVSLYCICTNTDKRDFWILTLILFLALFCLNILYKVFLKSRYVIEDYSPEDDDTE